MFPLTFKNKEHPEIDIEKTKEWLGASDSIPVDSVAEALTLFRKRHDKDKSQYTTVEIDE